MRASRRRICIAVASSAVAVLAAVTPIAPAATGGLASSLQSDPIQSIAVPKSSFTALSPRQIDSLRKEIANLDPGRIWIVVVSPRSAAAVGNFADPVFSDLPAGTLLAVADDPSDPNNSNWWVASSWQSSEAAQAELNGVIQGYRKGQGSFFDDLRLEIQSFARGDAAAGRPSLSSATNPTGDAASGDSSGSGFPVALVVIGAIVLLFFVLFGGRSLRQMGRASHRRREQSADAHEQAQKDLVKLGEEITRLDVDSSLATASPAGKDEYRHALGCYEAAERRLKQADDSYQFQKAQWAIKAGLRHVQAADQLFNPTRDPAKDVDDLEQLAALHRSGALTDAEFAEQKAKLIN